MRFQVFFMMKSEESDDFVKRILKRCCFYID